MPTLNNNTVTKVYYGSNQIDKLYYGDRLLYPVAPFTPASLNPYAYYDVANNADLTITSNAVEAVLDKSGNGHNLSQATASFRPTLLANQFNGEQVTVHNPTPSQHYWSNSSVSITGNYSAFFVFKYTGQQVNGFGNVSMLCNFCRLAGNASDRILQIAQNDTELNFLVWDSTQSNFLNFARSTTDWQYAICDIEYGNQFTVDCQNSVQQVALGAKLHDFEEMYICERSFSFNTGYSFVGQFSKLLIFDRILSAQEKSNLKTYYGF